jgi:hypothetical protein
MQAELLLVGTTGARIEIDPERLTRAERARRSGPISSGLIRHSDEIVGTFVARPPR